MLSKLTLIGMNNYSNGAIWDNLDLPEGYDKEIVVAEIIRQGGEFSLLYPDEDYLKYMIGIWSKKFYHNFERWLTAFNFDYEALYNLDVKATFETWGDDKKTSKSEGNNIASSQGSQKGDNKVTGAKAAYDASTFQNVTQDTTDTSLSSSESNSSSYYDSTSESSSNHVKTEEYRRGNQGITMSQEMLLAEYNAWRSNIYTMVAELFVSEFCICIYN